MLPLLLACLLFAGCAGGQPGDPDNRGSFKVTTVTTGSGTIYPYRIRQVDSFGNPTSTVLNIESDATLRANVNANNGVLPVASFDTLPTLPDGAPGNQFVEFVFSHKLDVESILSNLLANQSNSGLTGNLSVLGYNPATESTVMVKGRGFVNGITYFNDSGVLNRVLAVAANDGGTVDILDARAQGFPNYFGAAELAGKKVFTFVADTDNDLSTIETFPSSVLLRLVATTAVRDNEGHLLSQEMFTATTVGADPNPPQVLGYASSPQVPQINPGNNASGVDTTTSILVKFNKPVQPGDVGSFFNPLLFTPPTGGVTLQVTAAAATFEILYFADPVSFSDMCNYILTPAYNLPGLATVSVNVNTTRIKSITNTLLLGQAVATPFTTGAGSGITNAPVAPEAIYVGLGGETPGVSVIDLNGFGQGTGDINITRFPLNPNVGSPGVVPALAPGTTNLDAGSGGAMTLAKDSNLSTRLIRDPLVGSVADVQIGAPLDLVFNDENINVNTTRANQVNPITNLANNPGNCISVAPHPNPPKLVFPPPNLNRAIFGEEPTQAGARNLLVQGNPFASQIGQIGIYGTVQVGVFNGPAPPPLSPPPPVAFTPFNIRQQVGHFLYVLDSDNRRLLVLNSNRFTIIDSILMSDPVDLSISPNMQRLAVANYASSNIQFVDINPLSPTFHQVVAVTRTAGPPIAVVWQPDGEDVLALSTISNTLTLISGLDFTVRREVAGFLSLPIDIAVTPRFVGTGFAQGVYFAYILNANGSIAIYESGPDGVNGIGFNDMIGTVPNVTFQRARRMRYDYSSAAGSVLIGHVDSSGLGVVSKLDMTSSPGQTPLNPSAGGFVLPPTFRQKEWQVLQRFGGVTSTTTLHDLMSGNSIVDFTLDDLRNQGGAIGQTTPFNSGLQTPLWGHSGKDAIKQNAPVITPRFLFVGLSDVGKVDVFELGTGRRVTSIDTPNPRVVASYWRQ